MLVTVDLVRVLTPLSLLRQRRATPQSLTDSEETDNSSSSAPILLHNCDSVARVANLPNTEYFQQPFQRLRIAPIASDISPPITQQTASQVAIPYTNQYPFQWLQLSPRPTPPSPSYAFTPLPSQISPTFREPLHTPEHLPYMNIDTQTLQEDTTPQQLLLPQRRLSTTHYTTTCVAQDIVQPLTPTVTQQLPEQHHEPSIISTPFSLLLPANSPLISSDAHDIVPTTIRTTTVSATHVVDIPPLPLLTVDVVHTATQTDPEPFCLYCQWHEQTWLPQDTERRWRAVLRREIWNVLKDQLPFIKA